MSETKHPPRLLEWLIRLFIHSEEMLSIKGDMDEMFTNIHADKGYISALSWYLKQTIFMIPGLLKYTISGRAQLLGNYYRIAKRNLLKHKLYSVINTVGLATGITCCILIAFYLHQETGYDSFYKNKDRIYRVVMDAKNTKESNRFGLTYTPVADVLRADFPEIEEVTRIFLRDPQSIKANGKVFHESRIGFADPNFFKVLSFKLIKGTADNVLSDIGNVVISRSTATKYFGETDPLGKTIRYNNYKDFKVTGIFEDTPQNSHIAFDFIFHFENMKDKKIFSYNLGWGLMAPCYTYILTGEHSSVGELHKKTRGLIASKIKLPPGVELELDFQPIKEIHLDTKIEGDYSFPKTSNTHLLSISLIGLFILIIAGFNYMNLATAQAVKRAKEVGLRKVMGAARSQLIGQFLTESLLLTSIAGVLSLIAAKLLAPLFSSLVSTDLKTDYFSDLWIPFAIAGFVLLIGLAAGSYPALYLSYLMPVNTIKSSIYTKKSGSGLFRKLLIIAQFSICVLLIIGVIVVKKQLYFVQNADLGFKNNHNIIIPITDETRGKDFQLIKKRLNRLHGINSVTACRYPLISMGLLSTLLPEKNSKEGVRTHINSVDYDYIKHFGLKLLAGRSFSPEHPGDLKKTIIITRSVAEKFGFSNPSDIIGKICHLTTWGIEGSVVGVIEDFNHRSLHSEKSPVALVYYPEVIRTMVVSVKPANVASTIPAIEKLWKELMPDFPFKYRFMDERLNTFYTDEIKASETVSAFAFIAVLIGCMGLFGLTAFSVELKTREIGIRKIIGSSSGSIVVLLTKEFTRLILYANLIAWPLAYYLAGNWLNNFAYKISIDPWIFVTAGSVTLTVAFATIGYQSIKAALANPLQSIKYE